jgi:hydrogenase-4 component B
MIAPALKLFGALCIAGVAVTMVVPERLRPRALAWCGTAASAALLWSAGSALGAAEPARAALWTVPGLGTLSLSLDRLSALFLIITAVVFLLASVFSSGYLPRYLGHYSLKAFNIWYFSLLGSIALVLLAGDVLSFLMAWEAMSIVSYLLVNFEHREEQHIRAGYLMLAMGEAGTLAAAFALLLLVAAAGRLEFSALRAVSQEAGAGTRWAVFLLSFFGFGVKAGLVPFNAWLPRAHPVAPGNVSALLSGVILNLGLYGIARVNLDLLPPTLTGPGLVVLIIGTLSAFIGILYATTENDLKVMLAHSSIENIGIVTAGLGAGLVFTAQGHPVLATIAFVAALYHMTNHSLYKALLFLGAATVDFRVGTRDQDLLGGLSRKMPWTAACFLVGALSIAAMPPFNGFASEWLTLQTMLRSAEIASVGVKVVFALCGAVLALTAALAVTCFVKAFAMSFLGLPRSEAASHAVEAPRSMLGAMTALAALCLLLGVAPTFVISTLDGVLSPSTRASATEALVPPFYASSPAHARLPSEFAAEFHDLGAEVGERLIPGQGLVVMNRGGDLNPVVFAMSTSYMFPVLLVLLGVTAVAVWLGAARNRRVARTPRWDGGIRRLLPEMTYSATGFSNPVRVIFDTILRPRTGETRETVAEHFRAAIRRRRTEVHIVERLVVGPLRVGATRVASGLASMHHGRLNAYAAYGLVTLILALVVALVLPS